jgi:hypothetical protein
LVPVGWLWVNTHGSFPLGLVAIAALALGRRLDGEHPTRELIALKWSALGVLAGGVLNPVGPKLLAFPITMLARHDVLGNVAEWKSPDFAATYARVFLLAAVGAIVVLVRRPSYRAALPLGIFLAAGLLATRNVNVAMLALVPGSAAGLHGLGSTDGSEQTTVTRVGVLALAVLTPFVVISACVSGDVDLRGYPVAAIDWMDGRGLLASDVRVAEEDFVGNLLELRYGPDASAFIDDRYELHDRALVADYRTLTDGTPGWSEVLDRREIDVVLWRRDSPLGALLLVSADWRIAFDDTTADIPAGPNAAELQKMAERKPFVVACRPTVTACFGA